MPSEWYGSVETFEEMVRKRIRSMLYRQLGGLLFPYGWQLVGASPILWGFADLVAARTRVGHWREAAYLGVGALTFWLVLFPFVFQVTLLLANSSASVRARSGWISSRRSLWRSF
ncbi:unnamed protein product [Durusdinium trenchii]|uniref:Uncharacterized protein n=1 Tax=Durusdinium trenchii TaxID=1381693 RepID=A0ABP0HSH8_9DINO